MREGISSMDKDCQLLLPYRNTETKEKNKKKRKKTAGSKKKRHSTSAPQNSEDTEKPQSVSLPPDTSPVSLPPAPCQARLRGPLPKLSACSRKDGEKAGGGVRSGKTRQPKDLTALSNPGTNETGGSGAPRSGDAAELSARARESLRWEGVLEDPRAEEERLELYRANRRQRYLAHRQALSEEAQAEEETALPDLDQ